MMELLKQKNGLKTTKTVVNKQASGQDAVQKSQSEVPSFSMEQLDAMKKGIDQENAAIPKDETPQMRDARLNTIAYNKGLVEGQQEGSQIPVVKKEQPKQLSYTDMFKMLKPDGAETPEQQQRRERHERTRMRIAAIGDGLRAISNMYFATKGAKVNHDPNSDMTPVMQKRKAMLEEQRKKNQSTWLNGYLKAQALDEEARKNDATLAEQVRYHDQLAKNRERVGDQKDVQLQQNQDKIDLSRYRIASLNDYNERKLQIDKDYKDGLLSAKAKSNAIAELNASANMLRAQRSGNGRGGSSSSRNGSYSGNVEEYIKLKQEDPKGMKEAESEAREMGYSPKTASGKAAARVIYKRKHGKTTETVNPAAKGGSSKGKTANKPSAQKVKTTAVNGGSSSSRSGNGRTLKGIK